MEEPKSPYRVGNWTVTQLKSQLRDLNLSPVGSKTELIERLERHQEHKSVTPKRNQGRPSRIRSPTRSPSKTSRSQSRMAKKRSEKYIPPSLSPPSPHRRHEEAGHRRPSEANPFISPSEKSRRGRSIKARMALETDVSASKSRSRGRRAVQKEKTSSTSLGSISRSKSAARSTSRMAPNSPNLALQKFNNVSFFRNPFKVLGFFALYCVDKTQTGCAYAIKHPIPILISLCLIFSAIMTWYSEGPHQVYLEQVNKAAAWYGKWFLLGILSSIGLGSGAHTFLLFLGPHIARVTTAVYVCKTTGLITNTINRLTCPDEPYTRGHVSIVQVLWKVLLETIVWGAGTAMGEIPPYLIARASSAARRSAGQFREMQDLAKKPNRSILDNARLLVYRIIKKLGFFGILACASIPNPLFDLAGLCCGYFQIPFSTFFLGTFVGKAFIKSTIQALFVIFLFSKDYLEKFLALVQNAFPTFGTKLHNWFIYQRTLFQQRPVVLNDMSSSAEFVLKLWNSMVICAICLFVFSVIQAVAMIQARKHYKLALKRH